MTLNDRLDSILSECREVLALSDRATPGPWEICDGALWDESGIGIISDYDNETSAFLARSRTLTPKLARATITAIEALRTVHPPKDCPFCTDKEPCGTCSTLASEQGRAERVLQRIADEWEAQP